MSEIPNANSVFRVAISVTTNEPSWNQSMSVSSGLDIASKSPIIAGLPDTPDH